MSEPGESVRCGAIIALLKSCLPLPEEIFVRQFPRLPLMSRKQGKGAGVISQFNSGFGLEKKGFRQPLRLGKYASKITEIALGLLVKTVLKFLPGRLKRAFFRRRRRHQPGSGRQQANQQEEVSAPRGHKRKFSRDRLFAETKIHQVVVLHQVLFGFEPQFAGALCLGFTTRGAEIGEADDLRTNKALLQIRVDGASRLPRGRALANGPGPVFFASNGQKTDEPGFLEGAQEDGVGRGKFRARCYRNWFCR